MSRVANERSCHSINWFSRMQFLKEINFTRVSQFVSFFPGRSKVFPICSKFICEVVLSWTSFCSNNKQHELIRRQLFCNGRSVFSWCVCFVVNRHRLTTASSLQFHSLDFVFLFASNSNTISIPFFGKVCFYFVFHSRCMWLFFRSTIRTGEQHPRHQPQSQWYSTFRNVVYWLI